MDYNLPIYIAESKLRKLSLHKTSSYIEVKIRLHILTPCYSALALPQTSHGSPWDKFFNFTSSKITSM